MNEARLKLAFAGTPDIAATILKAIIASDKYSIDAVYTQPDKPAGRGRKRRPSPVKDIATQYGLALSQPEHYTELDTDSRLRHVDVMVVIAYGMILPETVLKRPKAGCINIHTSLLPRWRGAAPIQRAIQHGDAESGISIIQMDSGIDTGPVLLKKACPILASDTAGDLHDRLVILGSECLLETLQLLQENKLSPKAQTEHGACYARKISKAEAEIDWTKPLLKINNMIRAFNPVPVAFTTIQDHAIRVWESVMLEEKPLSAKTGHVIAYSHNGLDIACADGVLRITRLQLQGRKTQAIEDFYHGHPGIFNV